VKLDLRELRHARDRAPEDTSPGVAASQPGGASGKLARVAREVSFPLICLIFGLLFLKSVLGEKVAMDTAAPSALLWVVLPLSVLAIVLGLRAALKREAGQAAVSASLAARPVLIVLAAVLGVVLLTQVTGLLVACCLAMLVLMPALGFRRIIPVIVISAGSTIAIWLFFVKFLAVALPMGML
jgi:hypothetical protein